MTRILTAFLLLTLTSCLGPSAAFVAAVDENMKVIEIEYPAYVAADPRLSDDQKAARARMIQKLREAIDTAKGVK
jgi:hypothetical protein